MTIELIKTPTDKFEGATIDELIEEGFDISLESGVPDVEEGPKWYCSLYCGDSNSPWKSGTLMGEGEGQTIEEAVNSALEDLDEVVGYNHKKVNPKTSFSVFLADWKAKLSK